MRRVLLSVWLAVHLLLAQQVALAHLVGHIGAGQAASGVTVAAAALADDGDETHGLAEALGHVCLGCVAGLALDAACPPEGSAVIAMAAGPVWRLGAASPAPSFAHRFAFQSRAPPLLHD